MKWNSKTSSKIALFYVIAWFLILVIHFFFIVAVCLHSQPITVSSRSCLASCGWVELREYSFSLNLLVVCCELTLTGSSPESINWLFFCVWFLVNGYYFWKEVADSCYRYFVYIDFNYLSTSWSFMIYGATDDEQNISFTLSSSCKHDSVMHGLQFKWCCSCCVGDLVGFAS